MPGFPLTAWALRHPWGADTNAVLDRLRDPSTGDDATPAPAVTLATALLDELAERCAQACARWGTSRVAVILGGTVPSDEQPLDRLSTMLALVRRSTSIAGPAYHVAATGGGGAKALASADRLLRASLADAVLVGGVDDGCGAMLLIERHGDAFVELRASAEASGAADPEQLDEAAVERSTMAAWTAGRRSPLGYVHAHAHADGPHAAAERRVLQALLGAVPCCCTRTRASTIGTADGAVDAVLAAASLVRGYTPEPVPRELEHDRVLVHAFSPGGSHVALLLEARPS
jgi:3-oxoacyl-(acyl-carrier-protein) synthase